MLDWLLGAIATSWPAEALKASRLIYPVVNGLHILGFAALFGSIAVFDIAVLTRAKAPVLTALVRLAPRIAGAGLALAASSGVLMFSVQPFDYAANPVFQLKLALVLAGSLHAIALHATAGFRRLSATGEASPSLYVSAVVSLLVWTATIFAGRFIAFLA